MALHPSYNINLLHTQSTLTATELGFLKKLRMISIAAGIMIVVIGLFVSTAYLSARIRLDALEKEQTNTLRQITLNAEKEVLLLSLKDRLPMVEKIIAAQTPWDTVFTDIATIVKPPVLQTLSIDNTRTIRFIVAASSLEEVEQITLSMLKLTAARKIHKPLIDSMQIVNNDEFEVAFQLTPVF